MRGPNAGFERAVPGERQGTAGWLGGQWCHAVAPVLSVQSLREPRQQR